MLRFDKFASMLLTSAVDVISEKSYRRLLSQSSSDVACCFPGQSPYPYPKTPCLTMFAKDHMINKTLLGIRPEAL